MPVTTSVIQQVHTLARMDGMPKGLKIKNKAGLVLHEASKTAGVDYAQDTDSDDSESTQLEIEFDSELDDGVDKNDANSKSYIETS